MQLTGIHHVTAITGNPAGNLRFYTEVLGLRLVKKTVNQDDVSAYHLFYADKVGSPGTDMTFFDWSYLPATRHGFGTVARTHFRVLPETLDWWVERLDQYGVTHSGVIEVQGEKLIQLIDPEGQRLALVGVPGETNAIPWNVVPEDKALRGFHAITLAVRRLDPTARVLTDVLGFKEAGSYTNSTNQPVTIFKVGENEVHVVEGQENGPGRVGVGGVHHVAFRTPNDEEHRAWHERLSGVGLGVSPQIDRFYFRSIYFREPGGILFEIATDGPGFAADEDAEHLGERLALPPFLEPRRAQIEAGLRPIEATPAG
jgi:glyoxalase family protein